MGYDMTIRGDVPASPQHDIDQAKAAYDAAASAFRKRLEAGEFEGDLDAQIKAQVEPDRLWSLWQRLLHPEYARLNIWGMEKYKSAMLDLGMAHYSGTPKIDWSELHAIDPDEDWDKYEATCDRLTAPHGNTDSPTIPSHKLSSNDGWVVTPDEIKAALDAWERQKDGRGLKAETIDLIQADHWSKWIEYLHLASEHGGFRVR